MSLKSTGESLGCPIDIAKAEGWFCPEAETDWTRQGPRS